MCDDTRSSHDMLRDEIDAHMRAYLDAGGKVQVVPQGVTGDKSVIGNNSASERQRLQKQQIAWYYNRQGDTPRER